MRLLTFLAIFLAGVLGAGNVAWAEKGRGTSDEPTGVVSSSEDGIQVAATRDWTVEELKAAKPYPAPMAQKGTLPPVTTDDIPEVTGPEGVIQGSPPTETQASDEQTAAESDDISLLAIEPEVPYSYRTYPFSTVGRLFFTQNGGRFSCSAAVIKQQSIWTAGHCVHAGNGSASGWSTNVTFIPQYRDGSAPLGQWSVPTLWTLNDWYNNGNPNGLDHDMGAGVLSRVIGPSTGWLGFTWNRSYNQYYTPIGYPAGSPYNGQRMRYCPNRYFAAFGIGSPRTFGVRCDFTGGSSGGPWLVDFAVGSAGAKNYLNGNTSYLTSQYPGLIFSPYFDNDAKSLYDELQ